MKTCLATLIVACAGDDFRQMREDFQAVFGILIANLLQFLMSESHFFHRPLTGGGTVFAVDPLHVENGLSQHKMTVRRHQTGLDRLSLKENRIPRRRNLPHFHLICMNRQRDVNG